MSHHRVNVRDAAIAGVGALCFGTTLGFLAILFPLLMVAEGYDAGVVGLLAGLAAASQFVTRLFMAALLRRVADRYLIGLSALLIATAAGVVAISTGLLAFVLAQVFHGAARGLFWTAAQSHAVRMYSTSVRGLSGVNFTAGVGTVIGPVIAGTLTVVSGPMTSLLVGGVIGSVGVPLALFLLRLEPLGPQGSAAFRSQSRRNEGVVAGSWMSFSAGSWKAILDAYVPVVLAFAGYSEDSVGVLVAAGNMAVVVGSTGAPLIRQFRHISVLLITFTGLGLSVVGIAAPYAWIVFAALVVSGTAAGALQTLGPSIGADAVAKEYRGDVLAVVGVYRAGALMVAPVAVAAGTLFMPVSSGVVVAGVLMLAPVRFIRSRGVSE